MLTLIRRPSGPQDRRRGVTLVEMLVVVALVILMMVILVQIFQVATGAMSASRTIQELDVNLRQIDSIIRSDLAGVTAKMTPPNDPRDKRGYFEYGENAPADIQGEDSDDYLAFTTRAPDGQFFTGRQWLGSKGSSVNQSIQPTSITSQVAEVIYFLRNGNLYRRVFLVSPERQKSIVIGNTVAGDFSTLMFGPNTYQYYFKSQAFGNSTIVSWQGMNDISCRPGGSKSAIPLVNDLEDLTNRENRAFRPRFANDFTDNQGTRNNFDNTPDDNNVDNNGNIIGDGVPDYYPTIYTDGAGNHPFNSPNIFMNEASNSNRLNPGSYDIYAFPFIYPGMYSTPDPNRLGLGWDHFLYPGNDTYYGISNNHNALDLGDNLVSPSAKQTWWGFPTWRETMAGITTPVNSGWTDPVNFLPRAADGTLTQPYGLKPFPPNAAIPQNSLNLLPPVNVASIGNTPPYADTNAGSTNFIALPGNPTRVWEDDLLMTGVRSFDIKAYDNDAPLYSTADNGFFSAGYQDLGYGSTYYEHTRSTASNSAPYNYIGGPNGLGANLKSQQPVSWQSVGTEPQGFGHEGRIPPLAQDFRPHPIRGYNIGDNSPGVMRLTRVWDSWSTDYTTGRGYTSDIYLNQNSPAVNTIYPLFPAPYPTPLRGIQIQIRLASPRGEKVKSITIRVDFTDKL